VSQTVALELDARLRMFGLLAPGDALAGARPCRAATPAGRATTSAANVTAHGCVFGLLIGPSDPELKPLFRFNRPLSTMSPDPPRRGSSLPEK